MLLDEGAIKSVHDPVYDYINEWEGTEKESITIFHLLSMTSGLDGDGDFVMLGSSPDQGAYARNLELDKKPGSNWNYLNAGSMLLTEIVREVSGMEAYDMAQKKDFQTAWHAKHLLGSRFRRAYVRLSVGSIYSPWLCQIGPALFAERGLGRGADHKF